MAEHFSDQILSVPFIFTGLLETGKGHSEACEEKYHLQVVGC